MNHPAPVSRLHNCIFAALLLLFWGCSSPAPLQDPAPSQSAEKPDRFYSQSTSEDEGMWLLSQIEGRVYSKLKNKGLNLPEHNLYHPDSTSLNQAIVRINTGESSSGSGSFVSEDGLVLTNHEVVYNALSAASSTERDYLANGFYAESIHEEIPIKNYSLYITLEQKEVTKQIENRLPDTLSYYEHQRQSRNIQQQLIDERKGDRNDLVVEVNNFWSGNRQFMSVYKVIRDVRLVHTPPQSVGKSDNTKEDRYTGGYAFLRAYVGSGGHSKPYSESNIPFNPERHLRIDTTGVQKTDLTMTLGFPGETNRYESSYAIQFYKNIRNPILIDSYRSILKSLEYSSNNGRQSVIRTASKRASAANNLNYYQTLQRDIEKFEIIEQKRALEDQFNQWVEEDSLRNIKYRRVLDQLQQAYNIASQSADLLYAMVYPLNNNKILQIAGLYNSYRQYLTNSDNNDLNQADKDSLLNKHRAILNSIDIEAQNMMLANMLHTISSLPDGKVMFYLLELFEQSEGDDLRKDIRDYINNQRTQSIIYGLDRAEQFLSLPIDSARSRPEDNMVKLYQEMVDTYQFSRKNYSQHLAYLGPAQKRFVEGILKFQTDTTVYPDANNTLRFNGGRVQGYLDSTRVNRPHSDDKLAVDFLTTNDITRGSEGSPILNKRGEIVGIIANKNNEGLVSDYFYNPKTSRSINTDLQYILFVMDRIFKADRLLKEME